MKETFIPLEITALDTVTKLFNEGPGGLGNKRSEDHPNYCIIEIGQIDKSSGDLRRHDVTQTRAKDHRLTLMCKTLNNNNNNNNNNQTL